MPPPTGVPAPPPAAAMYQMMPQQMQQQQGQNIRPPQPPVTMQTGYPIRAPYHMGQPTGMVSQPQQQWNNLMDQTQLPTQQPMMQDIAQQQFQQQEGQNGVMTPGKEIMKL